METLYLLVPMSLGLVALIAVALWWALRAGQYDDLERPGQAILLDNDGPEVVRQGEGSRPPRHPPTLPAKQHPTPFRITLDQDQPAPRTSRLH